MSAPFIWMDELGCKSLGGAAMALREDGAGRSPADDLAAKFLATLAVLDHLGKTHVEVLDVRAPSAPVLTRGS